MGAEGSLVGRELELTALAQFLERGVAGGLVLLGESGMGKSALWQAGVDLATERTAVVLVATPGEGEERYSGSVLIDLLHGLDLDDVALPAPLRSGLDGVLLRAAAVETSPQTVAVAVHEVLAHLAAARQVVVFVDDVQWADPTSLEALAFAARRLGRLPVQFVLARRSGFSRTVLESVLVRRDLTYVEPGPLSVDETARLLIQHLALVVTPRVLRLVHDQSRGNPLFALEVGRVLTERGIPGIGEALGVPEEMATVLGLRVQDLPESHRTLLLAVALDPLVREDGLVELVGPDVVEACVRDRLVTIAGNGRVRAWHPLLAAAAREGATTSSRRRLHRRLAVLDHQPGNRARHQALGADEPNEELAAVLTVESATAASRGAVETGVELAELALARSPSGSPQRSRRVLDLAERLAAAGEGQRVTDFLAREIETLPLGPLRGTGWLMMLDGIVGSMDNVERFIENALADCDDDPGVRARALDMKALIRVGMLVAGVPQALAWAEESSALGRTSGQGRDWCLVHSGRAPEGVARIPHIKRHIWRGEPARAEPELRALIRAAESEGRLREAMSLRFHLLDLLVRSGRIAEARADLALLEDADLNDKESPDEEIMHAVIDVQTGDAVAARQSALVAHQAAYDFGHVWIRLEAVRVTGIAALIEGEIEEAEKLLREVWEHAVAAGVRDPGIFPQAPELIEALVLLGRYDDARDVLAWLREVSLDQQHPWGLAMVDRSVGLLALVEGVAPAVESRRTIEDAAAQLASLGLTVDAARARLSLGSALRRRKQWGMAREALESARAGFDAAGATGWATLARGELTKVGGRPKRSADELTPAELTTARWAADGLSNKEIARRTGVSINTVEVHLTRAYAKLGVRSRSQLAARLVVRPGPTNG